MARKEMVMLLLALSFVWTVWGAGRAEGTAARYIDSSGFLEDFTHAESVRQDWVSFGSPRPEVYAHHHGKTGVFDNYGDGWCESGIFTKAWFDFSQGGTIEAEIFLEKVHVDGCWIDQIIGFTQGELYPSGDCRNDGVIRTSLMRFYLDGHACWASPDESRGHAYISGYDIPNFNADDMVNQWVKIRVEIDQEGKVRLFVNDRFSGQSHRSIPESDRKQVRIFVGGRSSGYGGEVFVNYVKAQTAVKTSRVILHGQFGITLERYKEDADWDAIVQELFGTQYRVADWTDLRAYHADGGDLLALFDALGLESYESSVFVKRNGSRRFSSERYYFASRHEHNKPSHYLAHEQINNYQISLGSWWGSRPILAVRP